jgi:hypothetical protein
MVGESRFKGIASIILEKTCPKPIQKTPPVKPIIIDNDIKIHFTLPEKPVAKNVILSIFINHHIQDVVNSNPATISKTIPTE